MQNHQINKKICGKISNNRMVRLCQKEQSDCRTLFEFQAICATFGPSHGNHSTKDETECQGLRKNLWFNMFVLY
jgi:hypothetical protein